MPWLKHNGVWYEVPIGIEPIDDEEIYYGEPPEDEQKSDLAAAIALGLLTWAWNSGEARYVLLVEGEPAYALTWEGLDFYSQAAVQASSAATDYLATFVVDGTLPADSWRELMQQEVKEEYIRQMALARGGYANLTTADYDAIGKMLEEQYAYLDRFYDEIAAGQLSEAQIAARARMYVNSAGQAFEEGKAKSAGEAGYDEEAWIVNPALENCEDCLNFQAEGWQPIGYFPNPRQGATRCLSNCGCSKSYRRSGQGE